MSWRPTASRSNGSIRSSTAAASRSSASSATCSRSEADIFGDGHDKLAGALKYRAPDEADWREAPMALLRQRPLGRPLPARRATRATSTPIEAWRDLFAAGATRSPRSTPPGRTCRLELIEGRALVEARPRRRRARDRGPLEALLARARDAARAAEELAARLLLATRCTRRSCSAAGTAPTCRAIARELRGRRRPQAAALRAWYELFPRSHERRRRTGTAPSTT